MNSSVTAGRIVQTTSSEWLPCENSTGFGVLLRFVLPGEVEEHHLGDDEDDAGEGRG